MKNAANGNGRTRNGVQCPDSCRGHNEVNVYRGPRVENGGGKNDNENANRCNERIAEHILHNRKINAMRIPTERKKCVCERASLHRTRETTV